MLITLDNGHDHSRPNSLGPRGLASLNAAIDAALARDDIAAIAITGKPFIFAAGADLTLIGKITDREQAVAIGRIGHAVFDKLHTSAVPTFTFLNGLALGGGLEIALHCHYRTVSAHAAGIALPECFLGMLPGWGGAYLLPNLIGADAAVTVIIENALNQNRMLTGPQAHRLGIADAIFDGADFLERSLEWAGPVVAGEVAVERAEVDRGDGWAAAVARGREIADEKTSGAAPAPYRALELIEQARTAERASAFAAEDEALADLIMSEELRAGLYAFNLVQKRAKKPAGAPDRSLARPVTKVGIVGAGLMATQLALLFLRRFEVPVVISDVDQERVDRGVAGLHGEIDRLVGKRRVTADQANRMRAVDHRHRRSRRLRRLRLRAGGGVRGDVGQEGRLRLAGEARRPTPACWPPTPRRCRSPRWRADLAHPERVIGFHFFNPVAVLPLLEVVRAAGHRRRRPWPPRWRWPSSSRRTRCWWPTPRRSCSTGC